MYIGSEFIEAYGTTMFVLGVFLGMLILFVIAAIVSSKKVAKISELQKLEIKRAVAQTDYECRHFALGSGYVESIAKKDGVELIYPENKEENNEDAVRARNKEILSEKKVEDSE